VLKEEEFLKNSNEIDALNKKIMTPKKNHLEIRNKINKGGIFWMIKIGTIKEEGKNFTNLINQKCKGGRANFKTKASIIIVALNKKKTLFNFLQKITKQKELKLWNKK
jgi:hypothetical protein